MEENPYKAPTETGEPLPTEPESWRDRLRRLSIGPQIGFAWTMIVAGMAIVVAFKLLGWIAL
jgi:hypothetical protein